MQGDIQSSERKVWRKSAQRCMGTALPRAPRRQALTAPAGIAAPDWLPGFAELFSPTRCTVSSSPWNLGCYCPSPLAGL